MKPFSSLKWGSSKRRRVAALLAILFSVAVLFFNPRNQARKNNATVRQGYHPHSKSAEAIDFPQSPTQSANLESCLRCHNKIEPMHRYGQSVPLDKLDHGKDAKGLTCTACHGGNRIATEKETAHVRPRFPHEWIRDGKLKI